MLRGACSSRAHVESLVPLCLPGSEVLPRPTHPLVSPLPTLQGCNHIICRSKGCGFEFCWVCLSPWSDHGQRTGGYYACNKFKGGAAAAAAAAGGGAAGAGDPGSRAKVRAAAAPRVTCASPEPSFPPILFLQAELDKYLFFYQRYANHEQAARFAAKHKAQAQRVRRSRENANFRVLAPHGPVSLPLRSACKSCLRRAASSTATSPSSTTRRTRCWTCVRASPPRASRASCPHLPSLAAANASVQCRRVLKYTYVYGYYMPGGESSEKRLFEHLQVGRIVAVMTAAACQWGPLPQLVRPIPGPVAAACCCRSSWSAPQSIWLS